MQISCLNKVISLRYEGTGKLAGMLVSESLARLMEEHR